MQRTMPYARVAARRAGVARGLTAQRSGAPSGPTHAVVKAAGRSSLVSLMFAFVHGPSGALHFAAAALSAPSCSGLPPVPRPTNQRTRIFPSEVRPPALDGCAVTSAPDGLAVALVDGAGAAAGAAHPVTTSRAAMPSTTRVRQSLRLMCYSTPFQRPNAACGRRSAALP